MEIIKAKTTIENVAITNKNTEYSYQLPSGTKMFRFRLRNVESFAKLAISEGESSITYVTVNQGTTHEENIKSGGTTIYFQSDNDDDVAEIISFK